MTRTNTLEVKTRRRTFTPGLIAADWALWIPLVLLVAFLYRNVLAGLFHDWCTDPDYGHGLFVPFFAGYIVWRKRASLAATTLAPSNTGLAVMLGSLGLFLAATLGLEQFVSRSSLVLLLAGMVLYLAGWKMLKKLAFPLFYLELMVPLPGLILNQITFPLQLLASRLAAFGLEHVAIPVMRQGTLLSVPGYNMEVAQACSGIRSLLTMMALALAYLYFAEPRRWVRWAIILITVPIAVVSNAVRVFGAGLLGFLGGQNWADGFLHEFSGWLTFLCALTLLLGVHSLLSRNLAAEREAA